MLEWLKRRKHRLYVAEADGQTLINIFGPRRAREEATLLATQARRDGYEDSAEHWRRVHEALARTRQR
jgi:predicted DNA-binding WGR domain protein